MCFAAPKTRKTGMDPANNALAGVAEAVANLRL
jgi:hypothetical protein